MQINQTLKRKLNRLQVDLKADYKVVSTIKSPVKMNYNRIN